MFQVSSLCVKEFSWNKISEMTFLDPLMYDRQIWSSHHVEHMVHPAGFLGCAKWPFWLIWQSLHDSWVHWPQYQELHLTQQSPRFSPAVFNSPNLWNSYDNEFGRQSNSIVGTVTCYGLGILGIRSWWNKIFCIHPDQPWAPPASYAIGLGHCRGKATGVWHYPCPPPIHLVLRLKEGEE
jgi:hypothetical protein